MKIMKSFLKQVIAQLAGDANQVVAEKNYRKASAAVNGQIAALKAKLVEDEDLVANAEEALNKAKYPTTLITDGKSYVQSVVKAQENLVAAQSVLKSTQESIAFNEGLLKEFDAE